MKKTTSIILIFTLLLSALFTISTSAEGQTATVGSLTFKEHDTYCTLTKCDYSVTGDLVIPSTVDFGGKSLPVTEIGTSALTECEMLTVTIPDSVTSIGDDAFYACGFTSITIPEGVQTIGSSFGRCWNLTSVTIPDSVTSLGPGAFYHCNDLAEVKLGNGITSIGEGTFMQCFKITNIVIPDSVTSIGREAFFICENLTSITIPENVTSIGSAAFSDTNLETVYYKGSEEKWKSINIEDDNEKLLNAKIVFNYSDVETGDVNGDNVINNKDVVALFKAVSSGDVINNSVYDFNKDGAVNNKDVVALFKYVSSK